MTGSPLALLRRLVAAHVDFVVIGGVAVVAHGHIRTTRDLDITYASDQQNLEMLGTVLVDLDARLRGVAEVVPFVPDGRTLRTAQLLTLDTSEGPIDLLAAPPGAPPFPDLKAAAERVDLQDATVLVASLEHLIAMKRAVGRPRDLDDIDALEAIQRLRGGAEA